MTDAQSNSLVPILDGTAIKTVSEAFSAGLWRLLSDAKQDGAFRLIAINPALRAECETKLPLLIERAKPIHIHELMARLIEQAALFGIQAKSEDEWASILAVYLDVLTKVPMEAIDEAFMRWNRAELYPKDPGRHAFFPKPAEVYALAEPRMLELNMALYRARKAMEKVEAERPREKSPEDMVKIREMMAEFRGSPKPMPGPPGSPRETPQQVAERLRARAVTPTGPSGLSPLMRKRMGFGPEPLDDDPGLVI